MGPGPFSHPGPPQTPRGPGAAGPGGPGGPADAGPQMRHLRPGLRKAGQAGGSRGLPGFGETGGRLGADKDAPGWDEGKLSGDVKTRRQILIKGTGKETNFETCFTNGR